MPNLEQILAAWLPLRREIRATAAGLVWSRIPASPSGARGYQAEGPSFKITCLHWRVGYEEGYEGCVILTYPAITIIRLPPEDAKEFYDMARNSLN